MKKFIGISIVAASLLTAGLAFAQTTATPAPSATTNVTPVPAQPNGQFRPGFRGGMRFTGPAQMMGNRYAGSMSGVRLIVGGITVLLFWTIMILLIILLVKRLKRINDREHHHHHDHEHPVQK